MDKEAWTERHSLCVNSTTMTLTSVNPWLCNLLQLSICTALQLMDMLVEQTHDLRYEWRNNERPLRFTDTRVDEQSRGISMKSTPMSLVLEASTGKSFVMNMLDTPGNFNCSAQHRMLLMVLTPCDNFITQAAVA